ncbi:antitoxin [Phenylobacterium aquaticum]|uniref:antitoxin n=2 Tax=Phenylobacterium aquaticum TaxID=1763816 RepID=UPI0026EFC6A7|nr:AbrB/MazE/SpoVT family DNA-binding domain-containing protein [Phenylobacterium aquaticum]
MADVLKAKLFAHGGSQAVRLPKAFRFEGTEVRIRKEGDRVILEPVRADFAGLWARLDALADPDQPFPERPPQPTAPAPPEFGA